MKLIKINLKILTWSLVPLLLIALSNKAKGETAGPRGEIRVVESFRPDINVLGHNVLEYLFEHALDKTEVVPSLGVSLEWIDDTTLEVKLRRGVRFHNGEPFDADAVKFNFDYQRQHNPGRGVQVYMKNVKEIRVIDPYTLHIITNQPDVLLAHRWGTGPISGWVIGAPRYMEEVGWEAFLKRPVGTGPYKIEGEINIYREKVAVGDAYATLVANPDYWRKGYPKIQKITFIQYAPKEALHALTEGRVDLVTAMIPKDTLKVEESLHSRVIKGRDDITYTVGAFNLLSPHTLPLRNNRVREALNYAVNKEELLRYAYKGNGVAMRGALTEKSGVDLSETEPYEWNVTEARRLLDRAGYGEGFMMKLFYEEKDYLMAHLLQRFYKLLKIEVEIKPFSFGWSERHIVYPNTREGYSWKDQDWWICVFSAPSYAPELMGGQLEWMFNSGGPWRTCPDWLLEPLDWMYEEVLRTKDRDKRFEIYKRANEYIAEQALWLFTMAPLGLYGVNEELVFVPQVNEYLYLDYSSVTDQHWSLRDRE